MRFYTKQHKYYCGVDLHAKTMCILYYYRKGIAERVSDESIRNNIEADLSSENPS